MTFRKPVRGADRNPGDRFSGYRYEALLEPDFQEDPRTEYLPDQTKQILSENESPDLNFRWSLNPYRGCTHGCVYCYARPYHEYLGYSAGLDFETRIFVKYDAPQRLRRRLAADWSPAVIAISGATDPYQPVERRLALTRACLEVLAAFRNPVAIVTKNALVVRDADILSEMARWRGAQVWISVTTLRLELKRTMEPRTSSPARRLDAIAQLAEAGIPVGVMVAPVIPGLTDEEIPAILGEARRAGARFAGYAMLRLPHTVKEIFVDWLEREIPERKQRILDRLRSVQGEHWCLPGWGERLRGRGPFAEAVERLFRWSLRKYGYEVAPPLNTNAFRGRLFSEEDI